MTHAMLVGAKIRRLRMERELTQFEMAARLGISASYLNLIEHNQRPLTRPLLAKVSETLAIESHELSGGGEARLLSELGEVFGDAVFAGQALGRDEVADLVGAAPRAAQSLVRLHRAYRAAREETIALSERLSENPFLEASSHRLLTLLTSIRTFSEILRDNADLGARRRQTYIETIAEESEKLTDLVNEVFQFLAGGGPGRLRGIDSPAEQVLDYLQAQNNHFDGLEQAATGLRRALRLGPRVGEHALAEALRRRHGIETVLARHDAGPGGTAEAGPGPSTEDAGSGRPLVLSELLAPESRVFALARRLGVAACGAEIEAQAAAAGLSLPAAAALLRDVLGKYLAGALIMPYDDFREAARTLRHDIELLQRRFAVSFEQACHRLTTLQRPGAEGVPFHFLRVDIAGNVVKRFSLSGLRIPRHGGACPRWNVHGAFMNPGRIETQVAQLADGASYLFVSRAGTKRGPGHGAPKTHFAISIGCDAAFADQLVYADGLSLRDGRAATPVGTHCRQCERPSCAQRAFPPSPSLAAPASPGAE